MSFEKGAMKERVLSNLSDNGELKARLRQSLLDICNTIKITTRDVFFGCLNTKDYYQEFLSQQIQI